VFLRSTATKTLGVRAVVNISRRRVDRAHPQRKEEISVRSWKSAFIGTVMAALALGQSPCIAGAVGELIYPEKGVDENIDRLRAALQSLIDQFGKTVDANILSALQHTLYTVQSLGIVYKDSLHSTVEEIGKQRAALLYQTRDQLQELTKSLNGETNHLSEIEQNASETLEAITRASPIPWLFKHKPALYYRPDLMKPLPITLFGQNLGNPENRLIADDVSISASDRRSNEITFLVNRKLLKVSPNGFVQMKFVAVQSDVSLFKWAPWHKPPAPSEFLLLLHPVGPAVGSYEVKAEYPSNAPNYDTRTAPWSDPSPSKVEHCAPRDGNNEEFDPGVTSLEITKNTVHTPHSKF
jgi:hypothetical protein